jgi:23S rRNA (adenine2503-C2)-methyltransferase
MLDDRALIYDLSYSEIEQIVTSWGEPKYRAQQIWNGIYRNLWTKPDDFTVLPKNLKQKVFELYSFRSLTPERTMRSSNRETQKNLFYLPDKSPIETVLMTYKNRNTICVSTQSGCAMGCVFCATGQMGFNRNLSSGQIVEQVLYCARELSGHGKRVTNVVLMGMGEPFHNYENVMAAINQLHNPDGMNLGARRFTISTVGLVPGIRRFTKENSQINLAISLHAADDETRSSIMPVNKKYPVDELISALRDYTRETRRRVTIEWALINKVNDTPEQAKKLAELLKGIISHVNLIPLNPTQEYNMQATPRKQVEAFKAILDKHNITCTIRLRRGIDILAGCGQLASNEFLT